MSRLSRCVALCLICLAPIVAAAQDRFFDSNGVRIHYVEQGTGEAIVLLHGYTNTLAVWYGTGVLTSLAKDHRVIAIDLRGHGKSAKPTNPEAYGEEMGQDVVRLLDHLKVSRAHIVGYSLGGRIAAKLLTTHPDRFATATLGGSSGTRRWTTEDEKTADEEARELTHGVPFRSLMLRIAPTDEAPPGEETIRFYSQSLVAMHDPAAMAALVRGQRGLVVTNAQMAAVRVPTLAIVGSADPVLVGVNELKAVMPALKVVVIQGATHSSSSERGAPRRPEFVGAIREFMAANR